MRFSALRDDLLKALQISQYSVSTRGMMPILSGVKITASSNSLEISTNDLESSTATVCAAQVEEEGTCVVNHKLLTEILRDMRDEKLSFTKAGNEVLLEGDNTFFKLFTLPVDEFPATPEVNYEVAKGIDASSLTKSVQRVARAASKDEKRPTLMGILMEIGTGKIKMVSTDSYRLAVDMISDGFEVLEEAEYIIPSGALLNFTRITGGKGKIDLYRSENKGQLRLSAGDVDYTIRLIEGKFPKYEQFIPESVDKRVVVERDVLLGAVKRISLVNAVVKLDIKGEEMTIMGESREVGEGKEKLRVDYNGEPMIIAFNSSFLEDGLASVDEEEVTFGVVEPLKPGVIKGREKDDFIYIIMPVRV